MLVEDGAPRLDQVPLPTAAEVLGVSEGDLRRMIGLGFEPYSALHGDNNLFITQGELAQACRISTRQIRNLEERGLPSVGEGKAKLYPEPLAYAWYVVFQRRTAAMPGFAIQHLDPRDARREYESVAALNRAYWHLQREARNSGTRRDLDDAARGRLPEARQLLGRGERPFDFPDPG